MQKWRPWRKIKTWEMVDLATGKKPMGCKWVYIVKYRVDETLERYKTRLVAKGYTQTYDIDYLETFALVSKMNRVRILLSLATNYNQDLQQFNVKNAFLNGDLKEEIYMEVLGRSWVFLTFLVLQIQWRQRLGFLRLRNSLMSQIEEQKASYATFMLDKR